MRNEDLKRDCRGVFGSFSSTTVTVKVCCGRMDLFFTCWGISALVSTSAPAREPNSTSSCRIAYSTLTPAQFGGGRRGWGVEPEPPPMSAKAQVNVKPVFLEYKSGPWFLRQGSFPCPPPTPTPPCLHSPPRPSTLLRAEPGLALAQRSLCCSLEGQASLWLSPSLSFHEPSSTSSPSPPHPASLLPPFKGPGFTNVR